MQFLCSAPVETAGAEGLWNTELWQGGMKLLWCDTAEAKQGRIHSAVKFLYCDTEREGRKLKIKESSKGRSTFKGCAAYTVHPQGFPIYTHAHAHLKVASRDEAS